MQGPRGHYAHIVGGLVGALAGLVVWGSQGSMAFGQLRYPAQLSYRAAPLPSRPLWGMVGGSFLLMASGTLCIPELGLTQANEQHQELYPPEKARWRGVDDWLQYLPAAAYVGLSALDVRGHTQWPERLTASIVSVGMTAIVVLSLKACGLSRRPDGSSWNSFPSGHSATAFLGAAMLQLEYGEAYPCLSALGWYAAITTARLRMLHQRHWLGDTLAGAGIGIVSALTGYLLAPMVVDACAGCRPLRSSSRRKSSSTTVRIGLAPAAVPWGIGVSLQVGAGR